MELKLSQRDSKKLGSRISIYDKCCIIESALIREKVDKHQYDNIYNFYCITAEQHNTAREVMSVYNELPDGLKAYLHRGSVTMQRILDRYRISKEEISTGKSKQCTKCGAILGISLFNPDKNRSSGCRADCTFCQNISKQNWDRNRLENKKGVKVKKGIKAKEIQIQIKKKPIRKRVTKAETEESMTMALQTTVSTTSDMQSNIVRYDIINFIGMLANQNHIQWETVSKVAKAEINKTIDVAYSELKKFKKQIKGDISNYDSGNATGNAKSIKDE